ncbi:hypothetical protein [Streptomyces sp. NPDC101150]|uniref:hypothetical protein n=1 Tax=Streptomyces sp. NPDC101150 TaxID=3366114 RepID=UPI0037FBA0E5
MMRAPGAMELDERKRCGTRGGQEPAGSSRPIVSMLAATRPSSTAKPRAGRQAAEQPGSVAG